MNLNKNNTEKPFLYKALERIIFNENDFEDLKKIISGLGVGNFNVQQLKRKIVNSRIRILEDVSDFVTFHLNQQRNPFKENKSTEFESEIMEKNDFLTLLAQKIEDIYQNLKSE